MAAISLFDKFNRISPQRNFSVFVNAPNFNLTGVDLMNIYPNPSKGRFVLQTNATKDSEVEVLVYNAVGVLVKAEKVSVEIGGNQIPIHIDTPAGVYWLTMKVDGVAVYQNKRLVIQN